MTQLAISFEETNWLYIGAMACIVVVLLAVLAPRRKLPQRAKIASTMLRVLLLGCIGVTLAKPSINDADTNRSEQRQEILLLADDIGNNNVNALLAEHDVAMQALVIRNDLSLWEFERWGKWDHQASPSLEAWLATIGSEEADHPPPIVAYVHANTAQYVATILESSGLPFSLTPIFDAQPRHDSQRTPRISIDAPMIVLPNQQTHIGIASESLPDGSRVELFADTLALPITSEDGKSWMSQPIALAPSQSTRLTARIMSGNKVIAESFQTLVATEAEEVGIFSNTPETIATYTSLLPNLSLRKLNTDVSGRDLAACRAVIFPIDENPAISTELHATLEAYTSDGGCLLFTGLRNDEYLSTPPSPLLTKSLPVTLIAPNDPKNDPDLKPEIGRADIAKISVVFVIDHSGSMLHGQRWNQSKQAIDSALERINNFDRMGVMLFTDQIEWVDGQGISDVLPSKRDAVANYLRLHPPGQSAQTDIYKAVHAAIEQLKNDKAAVKVVVVVSDGAETLFRNPEKDHPSLAREAIENQITMTTIRIGANESQGLGEKRAERVMTSLATRDDLVFAVSNRMEAEIPKLIVGQVEYAYQRFSELEEEKTKPRESVPPMLTQQGFIQGTLPVAMTGVGRRQLGLHALEALGEHTVNITSKKETSILLTLGPNHAPALVLGKSGLGNILYLRAALDATSAGSWLEKPAAAQDFLASVITSYGRSRLSDLSPLLSVEINANDVALYVSDQSQQLRLFGINRQEQSERELPLTFSRGAFRAQLPNDGIDSVEVRDANETPLARASRPNPSVEEYESQVALRVPTSKEASTVQNSKRDITQVMVLLLAGLLCLMPLERYLRRT